MDEQYKKYFTKEYLMGPNSFRLLDELILRKPEGVRFGRTLDLGCGNALTSLFIAKELPHNTAAHLAVPFSTSAACRFLDLPPGLASPFSLKTLHRSVFRALEPSKPSKSAIASVEKFTCQLTTLIARYFPNETGAEHVYAFDLWVPATENYLRIRDNGLEDKIIPIHGDAMDMPFAKDYFDTVVSVDAYHYFGCKEGIFTEKILPYVKKGGCVITDRAVMDRPVPLCL